MLKIDELLKATHGHLINGTKGSDIKGISIDSRTIRAQEVFVAIKGENSDGHDFVEAAIKKGASCIIKEARYNSRHPKAISKTQGIAFIEVKDTRKALGDIARFQRNKFDIPVIAVTGSNGKTTAKEMIAWILSRQFKVLKNEGTKNNQIGVPLALLNLNHFYEIAVLELGTNHFGEIEYLTRICQPNIGIITNIGPSHLEYLNNLAGVFKEKYTLIENLKKPYIAILNKDDSLLRKKISISTKRPFILSFGIKNKSDFSASDIQYLTGEWIFSVNQKYRFILKTLGYYNIYNALVAITVGRIFGMSYKDILTRLATFKIPEGRLNLVRLNKVRFIDDTYNSNPLSLKEALHTLSNLKAKGRKIFVMGDMLELGRGKELFHYQAGKDVARSCDTFIAVGKLSKLAAEAARNRGFDIKNIFICESCGQARDILFNKVSPVEEDVVLVKGSRAMKMEEVLKV